MASMVVLYTHPSADSRIDSVLGTALAVSQELRSRLDANEAAKVTVEMLKPALWSVKWFSGMETMVLECLSDHGAKR